MSRLSTLCLGVSLALASMPALAISNDEVNAGLQFNFSNPGARSLGMGGAFTGLADDATAAYANPAGLTILSRPELAIEFRRFGYDTRFVRGGSLLANLPASGAGQIRSIDPEFGRADSSERALSYLSYVLPLERVTLAAFYSTIADFETRYSTDGALLRFDTPEGEFTSNVFPASTSLSLGVRAIGISAGVTLTDSLSLGLSLQNHRLSLESLTLRTLNQQLQRGDDDAYTGSIGLIWRSEDARWSAGASYRRGAKFGYQAVNQSAPGSASPFRIESDLKLDMPNVFGVGFAFRPTEALTLSADINRVEYSKLSDNRVDIFDSEATQVLPELSDGTEYRLGAEYQFTSMGGNPLYFRAGLWRDPAHQLAVRRAANFRGLFGADGSLVVEGVSALTDTLLFRPGEAEMHYSVGLGWASERFQVDAAADFSKLVDTYSLSTVWRF